MSKVAKKEMTSGLSVKIPKDLLDKARQKSLDTGISVSFIIRKALEDWVKK